MGKYCGNQWESFNIKHSHVRLDGHLLRHTGSGLQGLEFPPSVSTTFIHLKTRRALHHCLTNNKLNINIRVLGHYVS